VQIIIHGYLSILKLKTEQPSFSHPKTYADKRLSWLRNFNFMPETEKIILEKNYIYDN
jgi:hypothetical protein